VGEFSSAVGPLPELLPRPEPPGFADRAHSFIQLPPTPPLTPLPVSQPFYRTVQPQQIAYETPWPYHRLTFGNPWGVKCAPCEVIREGAQGQVLRKRARVATADEIVRLTNSHGCPVC